MARILLKHWKVAFRKMFNSSIQLAPIMIFQVLYGLYVINSDKQQLVGNHLAQEARFRCLLVFSSSWKSADVDTTGWAIEALSLVNKTAYQSSIQHAINYIEVATKNENNQSVFTIYGGNANTQDVLLKAFLSLLIVKAY